MCACHVLIFQLPFSFAIYFANFPFLFNIFGSALLRISKLTIFSFPKIYKSIQIDY